MVIFVFDNTLEGLLTAVFDAYNRQVFPDIVLTEGTPPPLFYDELLTISTDEEKAGRVWCALEKKLSKSALHQITACWLSEQPEAAMLLFHYMRKAIDYPKSIELDFGDPVVLALSKLYKKVSRDRLHVIQFLRFQKAADGTFFAALEPTYNVLPLTIAFLQDRFADQRWLLYDLKRAYGYYYDMNTVTEVRFEDAPEHLKTGLLSPDIMDKDEDLFQRLWKQYFKSIAIKERLNPKLHRQHMPARFWKYMTEKQR